MHSKIFRCVLGYFTDTPLDEIPNVAIPLHTLIELRPRPGKRTDLVALQNADGKRHMYLLLP